MHQGILTPPTRQTQDILARYRQILAGVMPLRQAHRRELPYAIRDLSRVLTSERTDMRKGYWTAPRQISAYVHYFLPWNLYRLSWLLPSLDLKLDTPARGDSPPVLLDLGSGPLTMAQALWICRPELRSVPLTFICADMSSKPMEQGLELLTALARSEGAELAWRVKLVRAPLEAVLRENRGKIDLLTGANVLNELRPGKRQQPGERMESVIRGIASALRRGGHMLMMEPGTRHGGQTLSRARSNLMECGCAPLAPCPHYGECPMNGSADNAWCHFNMPSHLAPDWLRQLTGEARFEKRNVSLSYLYACRVPPASGEAVQESRPVAPIRPPARPAPVSEADAEDILDEWDDWDDDTGTVTAHFPQRDTGLVRVISEPFSVQDHPASARYCCSAYGLTLLRNSERIRSGALVPVCWPLDIHDRRWRDAKSGAVMVEARTYTGSPAAETDCAPALRAARPQQPADRRNDRYRTHPDTQPDTRPRRHSDAQSGRRANDNRRDDERRNDGRRDDGRRDDGRKTRHDGSRPDRKGPQAADPAKKGADRHKGKNTAGSSRKPKKTTKPAPSSGGRRGR
ncbi:small ribosomal subunit Rsm22 family protein [Oleidesulfovibrio alaskensis]|uniref:small ribosomal subunit Rsm22 family protein n=1 Tax=Oleidesulfovibrio alaskensis TaxID=58180 RepID=UPI0004161746|nr:small ribosomal subunit Rsm22 family protein [Oleidesulfovibrio alaskensis]